MKEPENPTACASCGAPLPAPEGVCAACGFDQYRWAGGGAPQPFQPGTVLEKRYRIDQEVGRGGMGVVYRGTDLTLKRPVAIKAMRTQDAEAAVIARFMREAQALAQVEHPGLVPVYAVGREGGTYFMVMKFVEGRSLSEVLKAERALAPDRVRDLLVQVCDALGALHKSGLVHRDMKPGNLMIGPDGRVTVMDLGIVKSLDENNTTTTAALGTPRYMPPEMLSDREVDGRADLYSLGIIAYHALTGDAPFDGPTPMAILYKQAHEPPEPLRKVAPQVPKALAAAVEKVLAKDPDQRFPTAEAFADALRGTAPVAGAGGVRVPMFAVAGGGVLLVAAVLWWALRDDGGPAVVTPPAGPDAALVAQAPRPEAAVAAPPVVDAAPPPVVDAAPPPVVDAAPAPTPDAAPAPRPAIQYVTVRVGSDPSGAAVYEGRRLLGRTPLELRRPQSGRPLALRLERRGYAERTARVELVDGKSVEVKLEPIFELVP